MNVTDLRACLGRFPTGVTVVTARVGEATHGVTVNSFMSVSLDPPLVLVSIAREARAREFLEGNDFAVNILPIQQAAIATHFAGRAQPELVIDWEDGLRAPRLAGSLAVIECSPWRSVEAGDHILFIGQVEHFESADGEPLVFYLGKFHPGPQATGRALHIDLAPSGGWLGGEAAIRQWGPVPVATQQLDKTLANERTME